MPDITIKSLEGHDFGAYCAMPASGKGPGLLVIQEIFGVNDTMRAVCDAYAAQGYIALCPDLFWRLQRGVQLNANNAADMEKAIGFMNAFDLEGGLRDLLSALGFARSLKECSGKVGAVGYCLGGKLAYLMSTRSDVDAAVSFYGTGLENYMSEIYDIRMPTLLHIAEKDDYVPPMARAKILRAVARNSIVEAHIYEGVGHAFARPGGVNYHAVAAELANLRTEQFLARALIGE